MGKDWVEDIRDLHEMQGVHTWMKTATDEQKKEFIKYRLSFLREELDETVQAYDDESPEEIVDGLIDLCVVAISTLDAFGVEVHASWDARWAFRIYVSRKDG